MRSDGELITRCQAGERAAFDELFRRYQDSIFRHLLGLSGRADVAEDLCQETFLRFYAALPRFDPEYSTAPYLFRIATNLWRNHARLSRAAAEADLETVASDRRVDDEVIHTLERQAVLNAIAGLRPEYQEVLSLRYDAGLSYREIAEVIDTNVDTVATWLRRAVNALRETLHGTRPEEVHDEMR